MNTDINTYYFVKRWYVLDNADKSFGRRYMYTIHKTISDISFRYQIIYIPNYPTYIIDSNINEEDIKMTEVDPNSEIIINFLCESAMGFCWDCPIKNLF
jgi:hypothetical protein